MAGGPVRQPYVGVNFIPLSRIYEFGYSSLGIAGTNGGMVRHLVHLDTFSLPVAYCKHFFLSDPPVYISSCQLITCIHLFMSGPPVCISSSLAHLYTSLSVNCLPVYISSCLAHLYTSLPINCLPVYISSSCCSPISTNC
jgi:hypothetical protein